MTDMWILILLALNLMAQGMVAIGLLGIFISAFSDSFRERLTTFVTLMFAGVVLYLVTVWTIVTFVLTSCPGGGC